jgi:hypothetical protein
VAGTAQSTPIVPFWQAVQSEAGEYSNHEVFTVQHRLIHVCRRFSGDEDFLNNPNAFNDAANAAKDAVQGSAVVESGKDDWKL